MISLVRAGFISCRSCLSINGSLFQLIVKALLVDVANYGIQSGSLLTLPWD